MRTFQFAAFRDERYAARGEIEAASAEDAKAKIIERFHDEGLDFREYVDGEAPDHFMLTDDAGEEYDFEDETPPSVFGALKALIEKADDLIAAIEGITDQFEREVSALREAASGAEKALQAQGGAS